MNYNKALKVWLHDCHKYVECKDCPIADLGDLCTKLTALGRSFEADGVLDPVAAYGDTDENISG